MLELISVYTSNLNKSEDLTTESLKRVISKKSEGLLYAITFFKDDAINYLSDRITKDKDAIELLARIGEPVLV